MEKGIAETLNMIEEKGGAIKAISSGLVTSEMINGATRRKKEFDSGERLRIAGNLFRPKENVSCRSFRVDPDMERRKVEALQSLKKERNSTRVKETLDYVREVAKKEDNLVPPILEAVRSYATIGEITQVLKEIYGEYQRMEYFGMGR
jgi:methylmalonyl-CoA mutase N-terminal domain/subunit